MYNVNMKRIIIKSEDERLVYGEVYSPLHVDTDGEAMTALEIKKSAHLFLSEGRTSKIDVQHNYEESGSVVVESFIARANDPDGFIEGSWVMGVKIPSDSLWKAVKSGEINGFSFAGSVSKRPLRAQVQQMQRLVGKTEDSLDGPVPLHSHSLDVSFDDEGRLCPADTGEVQGHSHPVNKSTSTESVLGHSHRIILIENE